MLASIIGDFRNRRMGRNVSLLNRGFAPPVTHYNGNSLNLHSCCPASRWPFFNPQNLRTVDLDQHGQHVWWFDLRVPAGPIRLGSKRGLILLNDGPRSPLALNGDGGLRAAVFVLGEQIAMPAQREGRKGG